MLINCCRSLWFDKLTNRFSKLTNRFSKYTNRFSKRPLVAESGAFDWCDKRVLSLSKYTNHKLNDHFGRHE
jgi:hypothetical protein